MHYKAFDFARDPTVPVIVAKKAGARLNNGVGLSEVGGVSVSTWTSSSISVR